MNATEFLVYLRKLDNNDNDLIRRSDIQGTFAKYHMDIVEATRSAMSTLIGLLSRTGDTATITREEEVYTRGDRIVWSYLYAEITKGLVSKQGGAEEKVQQILEARLLFYKLGFENLVRLDKVVNKHVSLVIEDTKIVCKFVAG